MHDRLTLGGACFMFAAWFAIVCSTGCGPNDAATNDLAADQKLSGGKDRSIRETVQSDPDSANANAKPPSGDLLEAPDDPANLFAMGQRMAAQGKLDVAVELLSQIDPDHPKFGVSSRGFLGQLCFDLGRFQEAERHFRDAIRRDPTLAPAIRQLAWMLNRQGRKHAAKPLIHQLCRLGNVRNDELFVLISLPDAVYAEFEPGDDPANPNRLYYPIGPVAEARKLFATFKFREAQQVLEPVVNADSPPPPDVRAFYGRVLAAAQDIPALRRWIASVGDDLVDQAEYWVAVSVERIDRRQFREAARAAAEALLRDPSDYRTYLRINQALVAAGETELAERWWQRYLLVRDLIDQSALMNRDESPDLNRIEVIAKGLSSVGRDLEAIMWRAILVSRQADQLGPEKVQQTIAELNQKRLEFNRNQTGFPTDSEILCGLRLDDFPLPGPLVNDAAVAADAVDDRAITQRSPGQAFQIEEAKPRPRFTDSAAAMNIDHTYRVSVNEQSDGFAMYQQMGGGVAVLDYDLNGFPDLYFAQGGADPPDYHGSRPNRLYRNHIASFADASAVSGTGVLSYTLGVTAGDWNQDGFADLALAQINGTRLLINQGDGSFTEQPLAIPAADHLMGSSIAIADFNTDGFSDLYQVNYIDDPRLAYQAARKDNGEIEQMSPLSYTAAADWVLMGRADGSTKLIELPSRPSTGLGIAVADFDQHPGPEVFVANDVYPDNLYAFAKAKESQTGQQEGQRVVDRALLAGCAFGGRGTRTASMGISVGDFDRNGNVDLLITNFEDESNSFFLGQGSHFLERAVQVGIDQISEPFVGFGTQPIDHDNDGELEILVTNGRVERPNDDGHRFKQPIQLLGRRDGVYETLRVDDPSGYFDADHLGRGLATLDVNRDGRMDAAVTAINEPAALLINQARRPGTWIQLQLIGKQAHRDAVGAHIEVVFGDGASETIHAWTTTGDGYMSKNESVIHIGLGAARTDRRDGSVKQVTVHWPDGTKQIYPGLRDNTRWLLIQSFERPFALLDVE